MPKKFYVTKKQVHYFIKHHENFYKDIYQFKTNVDNTIIDLNYSTDANKNQIKFFKRVQFQLEADILLQSLTLKLKNLNL